MKFFVGTSGWNYFHWKEAFYPAKLSSHRWLEYYAKHFNTVEVNMTFYRFPKESLLKGWYKRIPKDFKLTLKAPRQITHERKLKNVKKLIKSFYKIALVLQDKLGCILWQFPPSLHFEKNKATFLNFLEQLDPQVKNAIEFRHKSWWNSEVYKAMKKHKIAFCSVSSPKFPKEAIVTTSYAYFRFHGEEKWYRDEYSKRQLKEWANKIKKAVKKAKAKEVYCYFNNDFNAYAIKNAKMLKALLKRY